VAGGWRRTKSYLSSGGFAAGRVGPLPRPDALRYVTNLWFGALVVVSNPGEDNGVGAASRVDQERAQHPLAPEARCGEQSLRGDVLRFDPRFHAHDAGFTKRPIDGQPDRTTTQAATAHARHHPIAEAKHPSLWADAPPQQAERVVAVRGGDSHGHAFAILGSLPLASDERPGRRGRVERWDGSALRECSGPWPPA
jgi:hypothetical protein